MLRIGDKVKIPDFRNLEGVIQDIADEQIYVLWSDKGVPFKYSLHSVEIAIKNKHWEVILDPIDVLLEEIDGQTFLEVGRR